MGSEWDFDVPAITGSNPVLSVESTLTNQVCGENYNIIRAWKVSDETGLEAFCTQTISVRNPELPEIVFQPESQSVLLGVPYGYGLGAKCLKARFVAYLPRSDNIVVLTTNLVRDTCI